MISKDCFYPMTIGFQMDRLSVVPYSQVQKLASTITMFTADITWMKILPDGVERDIAARIWEERSN